MKEQNLELNPWQELSQLIEAERPEPIQEFIDNLSPADTARAISRLDEVQRTRLLILLEPEEAADLIEELPEAQAVDMIEDLSDEQAAAIVDELPSDQQADLLSQLDEDDAEKILQEMDPEEAEDARRLLTFEEGTAGALMSTEYVSYPQTFTVSQILKDIRANKEEYSSYQALYAYVVTKQRKLVGVLRIRDLLLSSGGTRVQSVMIREPIKVSSESALESVEALFERSDIYAIPVVDSRGRLIGVVHKSALEDELEDQAEKTFMQSAGILGGDELRGLPLFPRSVRRLSVLTVNIGLNLLAASVIAIYQDTLSAVIALAVFLPIISDLSGCSGNQAIAVSIRELSLGLVKPRDYLMVLFSELKVGIINGIALGTFLGFAGYLWKENLYLSLVIGGALALNTVIAVVLGGVIPLVLRGFRLDPALASSPILTTVTDVCGFFLVLSFATSVLSRLT